MGVDDQALESPVEIRVFERIKMRYKHQQDFQTPTGTRLSNFNEISPQNNLLRLTQIRPQLRLQNSEIKIEDVSQPSKSDQKIMKADYFEHQIIDMQEYQRISQLNVTCRKSDSKSFTKYNFKSPSKFVIQDSVLRIQKIPQAQSPNKLRFVSLKKENQLDLLKEESDNNMNESDIEQKQIQIINLNDKTNRASQLTLCQVSQHQDEANKIVNKINTNIVNKVQQNAASNYLQNYILQSQQKINPKINNSLQPQIISQTQRKNNIQFKKIQQKKKGQSQRSSNKKKDFQKDASLNIAPINAFKSAEKLKQNDTLKKMQKNFSTNFSMRNKNSARITFSKQETRTQNKSSQSSKLENNLKSERLFTINDIPFRSQCSQRIMQTNSNLQDFSKQNDQSSFLTVPINSMQDKSNNQPLPESLSTTLENSLTLKQSSKQQIILKSAQLEVSIGKEKRGYFYKKYVQIQKNGKFIIFSNCNPSDDSELQYVSDNSLRKEQIKKHPLQRLQNIWEYANILQTNPNFKCNIEKIFDLNILFPGIQIESKSNIENSFQLDLNIYKFIISNDQDYKNDFEAQPFKCNVNDQDLILRIQIKFNSKNQQDEWQNTISDMLQNFHQNYKKVLDQNQTILFSNESRKLRKDIKEVIYGSLNVKQTDFQDFCNIQEEDFFNIVDTGDILLFRSNNLLGTWLTRTLTKSHFDHVGIILRFGENIDDLYVLESVGDEGVRMTSWTCARHYVGSYFDKIGYRKLNYELTLKQLNDFDTFRRNSTGKEYGLNLKKIFTNKSEVLSQQAQIKDDRQFFCSELVAKSLKVLGLLRDLSKSCTLYYPGCFEENQQIERDLIHDASFSPVMNILLDSKYTGFQNQQLSKKCE